MDKFAEIKLNLLTEGLNENSSFSLTEEDAEAKYIYNSSNNFPTKLPQEIILSNNITSNIFLTKKSDWEIQGKNLFHNGNLITEVKYTPRPKFLKEILSDGVPASKVVAMFGKDIFSIYVNRDCFLFNDSLGCHFCSSNVAKKDKSKKNLKKISPKQVQEAFKIGLEKDNFQDVMITSGTYKDFDKGILDKINYLQVMKEIETKNIKYHLVSMPPKSNKLINLLKEKGLNTIAFDIEVFDKKLFEKYCPGKTKYFGHNLMIEKLKYAAKVFPKNSVKAGFVCGLEPLESLIEGMEYFGKLGISSSLNIFHPDPKTPLEKMPRPKKEYILKACQEQDRINQKYDLVPIFENFGRRSSLDTEVYRGLLRK